MTDDYGKPLADGDTVEMIVGIPGRVVTGTVRAVRGRLIVINAEGRMSLARAKSYFPIEKL